jgi:chromosome segregation protein
MSIFQYKPSPFCILDEVDAALDEPNLVRFRRAVQQMSDQTQFILITHAKTTMEAAQTLYGVTMQEPGVSKLVSVRIGDHETASGPARLESPAAKGAAVA